MSIQSKARRDARRKQRPGGPRRPRPALEPHAELRQGDEVAGVLALQGEDWRMFLDGRLAASTDSAAMAMAMLKHAASVREAGGHDVRLAYSTTLRELATAEAEAHGETLHGYLDMLERERQSRSDPPALKH
jgi:hypothetical protein